MNSSSSDQENNNIKMLKASRQRKLVYRDLLNRVEELQERDDTGLDTVKEIGDILKQVNLIEAEHNIKERYQFAEETLLDSMVLSSSSSVLVKCLEAVDVNNYSYIPSEFASKIKTYCKDDEEFQIENLLKLLPVAQEIIPQVPNYSFVYGTYDLNNLPKPKEKKERQKRQKETYERKAPEKVTKLDKEEAGIEEIVKVLYDVLFQCYTDNSNQAIKYYDYIIDTSSFPNTVENMFYCSFLIRDGRASIDLDGKGVPYIKPVKKGKLKAFRDNGGINSQIISVISISEWEKFNKPGYIQKYKSQEH